MSNRRKPPLLNLYRTEFLRSRAWFARRDRWFTREVSLGPLTCAGCGLAANKRQLELHHLDYAGAVTREGRWYAEEPHEDLIAMHAYCHDLLHQLIDRDPVLAHHRTRRDATYLALERLRGTLHHAEEADHG